MSSWKRSSEASTAMIASSPSGRRIPSWIELKHPVVLAVGEVLEHRREPLLRGIHRQVEGGGEANAVRHRDPGLDCPHAGQYLTLGQYPSSGIRCAVTCIAVW